eukprot:symbB.v1.2.005037.t1/scaffold291.1/size238869/2
MALISSWKLALNSWSVTVPNPSLPVVTKTLVACQGQWPKILHLLWCCEDLDVVVVGAAISSCDRWEVSFQLLHSLPLLRLRRTLRAYGSLLRASERTAVWRLGLQCLPTTSSKSLILQNSEINACGKSQVWQEALVLLQHCEGNLGSVDVVSYSSSISACEKGSQWQMAMGFLVKIQRRRIQNNIISFNNAIGTSDKGPMPAKHWKECLVLVQKGMAGAMQSTSPRDYLLASVRRNWSWTLHLLGQMQVATLKQTIFGYNLSSGSCGRSAEWQSATELVSRLQHQGLKVEVVTIGTLLSAYEVMNLWQCSLQLVHADVMAINSATSAMYLHWPRAMYLQRAMRPSRHHPSMVGQNALLAVVDRWQLTLQLLKDMQRNAATNQVAFNTSLDVLKVSWLKALTLLQQMRQVVYSSHSLQVDSVDSRQIMLRTFLFGSAVILTWASNETMTKKLRGGCIPSYHVNCMQNPTCCDPTTTCYAKDDAVAVCLHSCRPGIHSNDLPQYQTPWTCDVVGSHTPPKPVPVPAPSEHSDGKCIPNYHVNCMHNPNCCDPTSKCYAKDH